MKSPIALLSFSLGMIATAGPVSCASGAPSSEQTSDAQAAGAEGGTTPEQSADGGTSALDASDANDAQGACSGLSQLGVPGAWSEETGAPPTPTGGTISPGTYVLTSRACWGAGCATGAGLEGPTRAWTLHIGANTWSQIVGSPPEETLEHAYAWSTSGNVVKLALTCGKGEHSPEAGYQATPNALAIFLHEAKNLYRFTLSRQ